MMEGRQVVISGSELTIEDIVNVARNGYCVSLNEDSIPGIEQSHKFIIDAVENNVCAYGVTTGFGSLCDRVISKEDAS
jgi:histidine ammonia-lyase